MRLYLATGNEHKARELEELIKKSHLNMEILTAESVGGMPFVDECEPNFTGNAFRKALALKSKVPPDAWVMADDSGLKVNALNGAPGVKSARYAGENATDEDNRKKLLHDLWGKTGKERRASFHCCLLLIAPNEERHLFMGSCGGEIATSERGDKGFGYDPVFIPTGYKETFAELGDPVKSKISHRARALEEFITFVLERERRIAENEGDNPSSGG